MIAMKSRVPHTYVLLIGLMALAAVTTWLVQQGFQVEQITPVALSLEDFYLATTHRGQKVGVGC